MRLEASISVPTEYVPKRKRNPLAGVLTVPVTLEIPEVSAPVAIWTPEGKVYGTHKAWRRDGDAYLVPLAGTSRNAACRRPNPRAGEAGIDDEDDGPSLHEPVGNMGVEEAIATFAAGPGAGFSTHRRTLDVSSVLLGRLVDRSMHRMDPIPPDARVLPNDADEAVALYRRHVESRYAFVDGILHRRSRFLPFVAMRAMDTLVEPGEHEPDWRTEAADATPIQDLASVGSPDDEYGYVYRFPRTLLEPDVVDPRLLVDTGRRQAVALAAMTFLLRGTATHGGWNAVANDAHEIAGTDVRTLKAYAELREAFLSNAPDGRLEELLRTYVDAPLGNVAGTAVSIPGRRLFERIDAIAALEGPRP